MSNVNIDIGVETQTQAMDRLQAKIRQMEAQLERFGRAGAKAGQQANKAFGGSGSGALGKSMGELTTRLLSVGAALTAINQAAANMEKNASTARTVSDARVHLSTKTGADSALLDRLSTASDKAGVNEVEALNLFDSFGKSKRTRDAFAGASDDSLQRIIEAAQNFAPGERGKFVDNIVQLLDREKGMNLNRATAMVQETGRFGALKGSYTETRGAALADAGGVSHEFEAVTSSGEYRRVEDMIRKERGVESPSVDQVLREMQVGGDLTLARNHSALMKGMRSPEALKKGRTLDAIAGNDNFAIRHSNSLTASGRDVTTDAGRLSKAQAGEGQAKLRSRAEADTAGQGKSEAVKRTLGAFDVGGIFSGLAGTATSAAHRMGMIDPVQGGGSPARAPAASPSSAPAASAPTIINNTVVNNTTNNYGDADRPGGP